MRIFLAAVGLIAIGTVATACGNGNPFAASTGGPSSSATPAGLVQVALNAPFVLRGGEQVQVENKGTLAFVGVLQDSRCPSHTVCATPGEATVEMEWTTSSGSQDFQVDVGQGGPGRQTIDGVAVELSNLMPRPSSVGPTPALADYSVTVLLSSAG